MTLDAWDEWHADCGYYFVSNTRVFCPIHEVEEEIEGRDRQ